MFEAQFELTMSVVSVNASGVPGKLRARHYQCTSTAHLSWNLVAYMYQ